MKSGDTQGDWVKGTSVTVSDEADYTVEYRSVDKAGNVEAAKSVAFKIDVPVVEPTVTATPTATATPVTPKPTPTATPAPPAPKPTPTFMLAKPSKTTVAGFAKNGLVIRVTCTAAMSGPVTVTVDSKTKKALKLKSATLAKGTLKCTGPGVKSLTLKPSASVKRALAKVKKSVKVTLTVTLKASGYPAQKRTLKVTLARR